MLLTSGFHRSEELTGSDQLGVTTFVESMGLLGATMATCQAAIMGDGSPAHGMWAMGYVGEVVFTISL